ncbi:nucleotidyltransferase family protein [Marinobacterium aestuariivivens]|uniref:Nucleotidyltransferase family protein n=1 Tax=Marinobacterium aestuariivivens TaxID=1698799 RepID=A0ABW1ZUZ9_9GAMM
MGPRDPFGASRQPACSIVLFAGGSRPAPGAPEKAYHHLLSASLQSQKQRTQVLWEVKLLATELQRIGVRPVLLKGAAYIYANKEAGKGRTLTDIDMLVTQKELPKVERQLKTVGWYSEKIDDYDQRYYREWTHEIPPLIHYKRQTVLDVHHNIFPVLRFQIDIEKIMDKVCFDAEGVGTLHLHDMIIHSATHLFFEGEFENGLRDLSDLDLLFREFKPDDWSKLKRRALELQLARPLFYALRYCRRFLSSPIPDDILMAKDAGTPNALLLPVADILFTRVLIPHHTLAKQPGHRLAKFLLYWRGHLLKMPLAVLVPHLLRKSLRAISAGRERSA